MNALPCSLTVFLSLSVLTSILVTGCSAITTMASATALRTFSGPPAETTVVHACPVTEPEWVQAPEDPAVPGTSGYGYYFVNQDRSIWASAWWTGKEASSLRANEEGIKVGWFRPAGATLAITGRRIDGEAPSLAAHVPCCYPTRFQATGLFFPTEGCWEVTAQAGESELSFIVRVEP